MGERRRDAWTGRELTRLRRCARLMGPTFDLPRLALAAGRPAPEVNLALDALIARPPDEAARVLNADPRRNVDVRRGLRRFLQEMFG